jgi:hypothetical protein
VLGEKIPSIRSVSVLGGGEMSYELNEQGLHLTTPATIIDEKAFVVKISKGN